MNELQEYLHALRLALPEYQSIWDDDLPYMVLGEFGTFLRDRIAACDTTDELVRRALTFINDTFNANADEVRNLLQIGVFEPLCDRPKAAVAALMFLTGDARTAFIETLSWVSPALLSTLQWSRE
jgi:hypothetical protein